MPNISTSLLTGLYVAFSVPTIVIESVEITRHIKLYPSGDENVSIEWLAPNAVNNMSIASVVMICLWIYKAHQRTLTLDGVLSRRAPLAAVFCYTLAPLVIWKSYSMWVEIRRAHLRAVSAHYGKDPIVLAWCALVLACTLGALVTFMTINNITVVAAEITLQGFWTFSFFIAFEALRLLLRVVEMALVIQTNAFLNAATPDARIA